MYRPNLLPYRFRPQPLVEPKRLLKLLIPSMLIFSLITGYMFFRVELADQRAAVQNLKDSINQLESVTTRYYELEQAKARNMQLQTLSAQLRNGSVLWSDIIMDSTKILGSNIRFITLTNKDTQGNTQTRANNQDTEPEIILKNKLTIQGTASNMTEIGQYALALRSLPWCEDLSIKIISEEIVVGKIIFEMTPLITGGVKK